MSRVVSILFLIVLFSINAFAETVVGTFGNTWKINEVDQAEYFKEKALKNRKKLEAYFQKLQKKAFDEIAQEVADIPSIKEHKKVLLKTEYSLPHDVYIPGKDGKWYYYPAGYTFNPMDYVKTIGNFYYIVINPAKKAELKLLEQKIKENNKNKDKKIIKVLLAGIPDTSLPEGCSYSYLSKEVAEKLKIEGTPAFISATKKGLEVEYVPVENF